MVASWFKRRVRGGGVTWYVVEKKGKGEFIVFFSPISNIGLLSQ
jgi:hypothetical protein